jgi:hypothetical protein
MKLDGPQDVLREYAQLNRQRKGDGVTAMEYQRWNDLRGRLEKTFPGRRPPGSGGKTRIRVEYEDDAELARCVMVNVRPIGLFVNTPFASEPGTSFELRVHILQSGDVFDSSVTVVSNNVGPDFSTAALGMGLRFASPDCALRRHVEKICGQSPR